MDREASDEMNIDILVGLDHYWDLVGQKSVKLKCGLVGQDSVYGWLLFGSIKDHSSVSSSEGHQLLNLENISEATVKRFWDIESLGICPKEANSAESDQCWECGDA